MVFALLVKCFRFVFTTAPKSDCTLLFNVAVTFNYTTGFYRVLHVLDLSPVCTANDKHCGRPGITCAMFMYMYMYMES